jgi:hypothetical protein
MRITWLYFISTFILISPTLLANQVQNHTIPLNTAKQLLHNLSTQPHQIHHKSITIAFTPVSQQRLLAFLDARLNLFNAHTLQLFGDFYIEMQLDNYDLKMMVDDGTLMTVKGTAVAHYSDDQLTSDTWYPIDLITLPSLPRHRSPPAPRLLVAWRPSRPTEQFFKTIIRFVQTHPLKTVRESFTGTFSHQRTSLNYQDDAEFLTFLYQPEAGYQVQFEAQDGARLTLKHFDVEPGSLDDTCLVNMQQHIEVPNHPPQQQDVAFACRIESKD